MSKGKRVPAIKLEVNKEDAAEWRRGRDAAKRGSLWPFSLLRPPDGKLALANFRWARRGALATIASLAFAVLTWWLASPTPYQAYIGAPTASERPLSGLVTGPNSVPVGVVPPLPDIKSAPVGIASAPPGTSLFLTDEKGNFITDENGNRLLAQ